MADDDDVPPNVTFAYAVGDNIVSDLPALPPPPPPLTAEDIDARLAKLDHIKGRLSDEEYERRRNTILDSI